MQTHSVLQDTLGIKEVGKKWSIRKSLERLSKEDEAVFVLINHRDAKSYWLSQLKGEPELQKRNRKVVGTGAQILRSLGLSKIRSMELQRSIVGYKAFILK